MITKYSPVRKNLKEGGKKPPLSPWHKCIKCGIRFKGSICPNCSIKKVTTINQFKKIAPKLKKGETIIFDERGKFK